MSKYKEYNLFTPDCMFIDDTIAYISAMESASTVMDVNGEPMKVFICTDKIIEDNKLKQVTSPIAFIRNREPSFDGIFSEEIFGSTQAEKTLNHGYISLRHKFFHPFVYETLCSLHSKIPKVLEAESAWKIEDGKLKEVENEDDPDYDANNTGLQFLISNYDKLRKVTNDSILHNDKVNFLKCLSEDEVFITKWMVIPVAYRDIASNGNMTSVHPINNQYNRLISLTNSLDSGIYGYIAHKTMAQIQNLLVEIRKSGQSLIEKKNGLLHRSILGKGTTNAVRGVISVPSLVGCDYPEDCQVDMLTTGIPLSQCIIAGYPFVLKYILDWVERNLKGGKMQIGVLDKSGVMKLDTIQLKDHTALFDKSYIDKRFQMFTHGFGGRWEPIEVETVDGNKVNLIFTGTGYTSHPGDPEASSIVTRPMTWCDLIYIACEDTLSDKHVYCTRYPVEDYFNITPSRLSVLSTIKTTPMMVNGKYYPHYPVIEPGKSEVDVSRSFINTLSVSNLHLAGYRGDYDGDTVSVKMCYTQEANMEAEEKIHSLTHYITVNGELIRFLDNESTLCMYNMTKREGT